MFINITLKVFARIPMASFAVSSVGDKLPEDVRPVNYSQMRNGAILES